MPFLELFDETLDINSTENYELSVQVSPDGLSFSILDTLRNKFVMIRNYEPDDGGLYDTVKLGELINKDDFLTKQYKKANLITPSLKSTLVPKALFEDSKKEEYFSFNQINSEGEMILTNEIPDPDSMLIFSLPDAIVDLLKESFPKAYPVHQLKPLFQHMLVNRRAMAGYYIHVHLERDFFNLIIFDQNALEFCNTFHYKTLSDIQYYVFYVLKRMNISQEETLNFSGMTNDSKEIFSGFSDFIKTIRFAEPTGNFTFSYVFNETDLHRFLNLFSITNCG